MPASFRDYYETLGVSKSATADEIKKAFRKLARQHHPDLAKDKKAAEAKFKEINEAYEVLGNPENRKKYDAYGANWSQAAAGGRSRQGAASGMPGGFGGFENMGGFEQEGESFHFGGTGYSDFFEQFFGTRRSGSSGSRSQSGFGGMPQRGSDIEADLLVTLEEVLHGATRQVSFRKAGSEKLQTYTVKIPQGVHEGQRIRLAGQGGSGGPQGTPGDLYLCIKLQQHPDFYFEGSDVYYDLEIPAWQAVLGGELTIPVPEGRVKLKIPAGTESGKKFRIPHKGLPSGGSNRGDFFAVVTIKIPTTLSAAEKAAWEQLRMAQS
ncbi:MAG: J domain-containing protein [Chthoniobacterales bacterium]|nr:J domain-containing protein [Chthoniobacterales bacterium]